MPDAKAYVTKILTEGCPRCGDRVDISRMRMACPTCGWVDNPHSFKITMQRRSALADVLREHQRRHPAGGVELDQS